MVLAFTKTGRTAGYIAKYRSAVPILTVSKSAAVILRSLNVPFAMLPLVAAFSRCSGRVGATLVSPCLG